MAAVSVTSVRVLDNPAPFTNPLQFEIQYECLHHLKHGERVERGRRRRAKRGGDLGISRWSVAHPPPTRAPTPSPPHRRRCEQ